MFVITCFASSASVNVATSNLFAAAISFAAKSATVAACAATVASALLNARLSAAALVLGLVRAP